MDEQLRLLERKAASGGPDDKLAFHVARKRAGIECELYDLISGQLVELAWRADYALSPKVGLDAFIGGFRERGFAVERDERAVHVSARKTIGGIDCGLVASMSVDELLKGWSNHPVGSPHSLYDSICETYDRLGKRFLELAERNAWAQIRNGESIIVRRLMEDFLEKSISTLHEHAFLFSSGEIPAAAEPRLVHEVKSRFPIELYERAKKVRAICGPDAPFILETDLSEFTESYHPSVSAMHELFWGMYLDAFARVKCYPVLNEESRLRSLITRGHEGLTTGKEIWPPKRR
ncbi:hypothetical protein J4219_08820 [Candidatus Woesearchaeota archaeon]|nr:hypothetical protein [Candidatus Woesearchaeota archaeon]